MGLDNIWENNGPGIAATGMLIVFVALILIAGFIALLPKILDLLADYLPAEHHPQHQTQHQPKTARSSDEDEVAVAIGFALHQIQSGKK